VHIDIDSSTSPDLFKKSYILLSSVAGTPFAAHVMFVLDSRRLYFLKGIPHILDKELNMAKRSGIFEKNVSVAKTGHPIDGSTNYVAGQKKIKSVDFGPPCNAGSHLQWEIRFTLIAILFTLITTAMLFKEIYAIFTTHLEETDYYRAGGQIFFALVVFFLIYGNIVYQVTRIGYFRRLKSHRPARRNELDRIYDGPAPSLTFLIPSYKEESQVIRQSLLSAALQEYPNRRVVLLIDDPPTPTQKDDISSLMAARRLPQEIQHLIEVPAAEMDKELNEFLKRKNYRLVFSEEYIRLAGLYQRVAARLKAMASSCPAMDHASQWFVQKTFLDTAENYIRHADDLEKLGRKNPISVEDAVTIHREYRRLATLFKVKLTSFERKKYVNLSHESNKAMNLNSYIGLLGKCCCETKKKGSLYLEEIKNQEEGFLIPDADYLITLDADSMLLPEYALRLVHIMEQPGNEKLAVAQTPYNAFPNPPGLLERIAGATTDIQHIIHQGFTHYHATYWVGANALLRKTALADICTIEEERGFAVKRYIQDRTVIEDTESSIDLIDRGWKLYNYPERLAYSATPPDFGALLIQRRRWANGGLIILPKLLRYWFKGINRPDRMKECLLRLHYLISIAGVNIGLLLIFFFPFEENLRSIWLPLTALPYYFFYGRDLVQSGYKTSDLFRVYALNLLLLPVNLGGVFKSLHQAWTGQKIPFGRTPKVMGRTAAPALYHVSGLLLLGYCFTDSLVASTNSLWFHALFAFVNAVFFAYAVLNYVGLEESIKDIHQAWVSGSIYQSLAACSQRIKSNYNSRRYKTKSFFNTMKPAIGPVHTMLKIFTIIFFLFFIVPETTTPGDTGRVPVLTYHAVSNNPDDPGDPKISFDMFEAQMKYLHDNQYVTLSIEDLLRFMKGYTVPDKAIVLTFDDGWKSMKDVVPVLNHYHFKAAFSIIPGEGIGNPYLDWVDLKDMAKNPDFEFVSHSMTHPWRHENLITWAEGETDGKSLKAVEYELTESKRVLETMLHRKINCFAWPCGLYNDRLVEMAKNAGYKALFTIEEGANFPYDDVMKIKRIVIDGACSMDAFIETLQDYQSRDCYTKSISTKVY
jgi:cellulose synthase (UDP-forming)